MCSRSGFQQYACENRIHPASSSRNLKLINIAFVCNDTRGGVQPYVALAAQFRKAGFNVRAICPAHSASLFHEAGISVAESLGTAQEWVNASRRAAEAGPLESIQLHALEAAPRMKSWQSQTIRGCQGANVILGGLGGLVTAMPAARELKIPFVQMHLQPVFAHSRDYPGVLSPQILSKLGLPGNKVGHMITDAIVQMMLMGQAPARSSSPVFYGFSQQVVPVRSSENCQRIANGYWILEHARDWHAPPDLDQFLSSSQPVICLGFGSMVSRNSLEFFSAVAKAVKRTGARAVILSGWNEPMHSLQDEDIFIASEVPHSWLFSRVNSVVHHGGAGTTGAAFTAGKPQLVVPFGVDQPFWGGRVAALGTGPTPIPRRKLCPENLAEAIKISLGDKKMIEKAAMIGRQLRSENGVESTVEQFSQMWQNGQLSNHKTI